MFKTSVSLSKVLNFNSWCDYFDTFCALVKDEDVLDEYSTILEENDGFLKEFSEMLSGESSLKQKFTQTVRGKYSEIRLVIEGTKDHKTIKFSIDGKDENNDKVKIPLFILSNQGYLEGLTRLGPCTLKD